MNNMKNLHRLGLMAHLAAFTIFARAQADDDHTITNGIGETILAPNGFAPAAPRTFNIGTAPSTGHAFEIHGEQMTPAVADVFKTDAPGHFDTYWRMFHIGKQYGNLFHLDGDPQNKFNINAPRGHLSWYTENKQRMRLNFTQNVTVGAFANVNTDGFVGISERPEFFDNTIGPFSRLHLVDAVGSNNPNVYAQQLGFRPWQRNGITFTGNSDQGYIGQKYDGNDNTDMVIQWSDNPQTSPWGCDRMKFVFSSTYNAGSSSGMNSMQGMEAMRFWPKSATQVNVGVGDFAVPGSGDPTERLDVLTGRVRIRQLPDDLEVSSPFKLMVVDDTPGPSPERGVVKWLTPSALGICNSGWSLVGNDPCTAWNGNPCIPQGIDRVGVGTSTPSAKLDVLKDIVGGPGIAVKGECQVTGSGGSTIGVQGLASAGLGSQFGVLGVGFNGNLNYGVSGNAIGGTVARGLAGQAQGSGSNFGVEASSTAGALPVGVHGIANGAGTAAQTIGIWGDAYGGTVVDWAGYFNGPVYSSGGYFPSDENLKSNILDMDDGLGVIMQLQPKTFNYNVVQYPRMHLPEGDQAGVMAQDLENVLPALVRTAVQPPLLDSLGNIVEEAMQFKAVRMEGLLPFLIGAVQQLKQQNDALQDQINGCCANMAPADQRSMTTGSSDLNSERLLISPNPFTDHTTVNYYVPQSARVSLQVSDGMGKPVSTLREEQAMAGSFTYEWNTQSLAPGTYFVALLVDGNVVVKKAVKVGER